MFLLIAISFVTISIHNIFIDLLNSVIWGISVIDYVYFFIRSDNKKSYVKKHIFELIAIVPLGQGFLLARSFRLIRFIRLTAIGSRYIGPVFQFLKELNCKNKLAIKGIEEGEAILFQKIAEKTGFSPDACIFFRGYRLFERWLLVD